MPDTRNHRGPHPEDSALFHQDAHAALVRAVRELSWLRSRDYAIPSALKLVGDRHHLTSRQRTAVLRSTCSDEALARRQHKQVSREAIKDRRLLLDGYNVLTTVEAALGNGILLLGRDGCVRDMASLHGSYRKVEETLPAIHLIGRFMAEAGVDAAHWYLDSPVSNSGRLGAHIREAAEMQGWPWEVELVQDPDPVLAEAGDVVATADSVILDQCRRWFNLAREVVTARVPGARIVDLSGES